MTTRRAGRSRREEEREGYDAKGLDKENAKSGGNTFERIEQCTTAD